MMWTGMKWSLTPPAYNLHAPPLPSLLCFSSARETLSYNHGNCKSCTVWRRLLAGLGLLFRSISTPLQCYDVIARSLTEGSPVRPESHHGHEVIQEEERCLTSLLDSGLLWTLGWTEEYQNLCNKTVELLTVSCKPVTVTTQDSVIQHFEKQWTFFEVLTFNLYTNNRTAMS